MRKQEIFGSALSDGLIPDDLRVHEKGRRMPVISRFFGIVIFMNFNGHHPPHFHARYQDQEVTVEIPPLP